MAPAIALFNRQRAVRIPMAHLRRIAPSAVAACLDHPGPSARVLATLEEVEATFVSDGAIAKVHAEFMNDPTATDVITFAHGEIVISAQTAARESQARGEPFERELIRYLVHGLLHLNGHEDADPKDAAAMWAAQETVVADLWTT